MKLLISIFGDGKDLNVLQMSCRGFVIFFIALILIRIAGRRSFGLRTPFDNIIVILLGAVLSRAVVGASPFIPTIACTVFIVLLHRIMAYCVVHSEFIAKLVEGNKIILFEKNKFIKKNMDKGLVCKEDILESVRKSALTDAMEKIDRVYIERNGEISAIKKEEL